MRMYKDTKRAASGNVFPANHHILPSLSQSLIAAPTSVTILQKSKTINSLDDLESLSWRVK